MTWVIDWLAGTRTLGGEERSQRPGKDAGEFERKQKSNKQLFIHIAGGVIFRPKTPRFCA